ncbi:outer membrane protein [Vibrio ishigakensis]|uniref:Outer membrane protein n=1 Tax=Vibrio ishigakensis TaxID=1481914 RepID=A0A0B8PM96_9VIBR|nr:outer membrane protein [Vibrio ishigakensis]
MDQFKDPQDGRLDASQYILDNTTGFLPVPVIVNDPAIGAGGGAALLFFHESEDRKQKRLSGEMVADIPTSVSGVVGVATSNGTKVLGGFHSGNWYQDRIRYLGGLFGAEINMKFYDQNDAIKFKSNAIHFFQDIDFRIGASNFFVGANYTYTDSDTSFDLSELIPEIGPTNPAELRDGALGVKLTFDNRNNQFAPTKGTKAGIEFNSHNKAFGAQFDYQLWHAYALHYARLSKRWGLGLRADTKTITGDEPYPFYAPPSIDMRGIAMMRYQGDSTGLAEAELSYDIDDRWTVLGFVGTGVAVNEGQKLSDVTLRNVQGVGFRYLIARQLGLTAGLDVAVGPEETTTYIQFGGAW